MGARPASRRANGACGERASVIRCPNCGNENPPGSRFCANCGRRLPEPAALEAPPEAAPAPSAPPETMTPPINPTDLPPTHPEWRMSPPEPYVPQRRRRTWLWIVIGIIAACLVVCLAVVVFINTPPGRSIMNNLATQAALQATPTAGAATPAP
ncbi:MAG TPA: zinc ribbon domain-containing protein [Thermomicrobiales bacterium]|nr:zinc ribbon domain-containing protein [Thermomicrobiales bacterium]